MPACAPSMMPGMSATTKVRWPESRTTPRLGSSVVNGIVGDLGPRRRETESSVLLPALGSPTRPTSAMSLSTSSICRSCPSSPGSHSRGAWCVGVAKRALPRPPRPPRATSRRVAGLEHLAEQLAGVGVPDDGAGRHREVDVVGRGAGLGLALAVLAALGLPHGAVAVVEQRGEVGVAPHVDAAAVAAVAAVGPALGLVLEPGEGAGARPARTRRHPARPRDR